MRKLKDFILCFLRKDCEYSKKGLLTFLTFFLITYLAIFTDNSYYELLIFLSVLLGINSYDKGTWYKHNEKEEEEIVDNIKKVKGFANNKEEL